MGTEGASARAMGADGAMGEDGKGEVAHRSAIAAVDEMLQNRSRCGCAMRCERQRASRARTGHRTALRLHRVPAEVATAHAPCAAHRATP
jgi:hypothetical protein